MGLMMIMKKFFIKNNGAIAIEAVLSMFIFALAIISIMFMSLMVRVQSTMQYALGQTAKEISGYYYLIDKLGLAINGSTADVDVESTNALINTAIEFGSEAQNAANDISVSVGDGVSFEDIKAIGSDVNEMKSTAAQLGTNLKDVSSDIKGQLKGTLTIIIKSAIQKGLSNYVAPWICRSIIPKYIGGDTESCNNMLESMGVTGGIANVDFSQSTLLSDGRTIQLVAIYKMDLEKLTLGMIQNQSFTFKQVATTAAWVRDESDDSNLKSVAEAVQ